MSGTAQLTITICNKKGLHARAAAKFVKVVGSFESELRVSKISGNGAAGEAESVSGTSILGLMMLGAEPGSELLLKASGADAQALVDAVAAMVADRFGEGE